LQHNLRSVLAMPLVAGDRILGAITFFSTRRRDFPRQRVDMLHAVAAQAALSILSAYDQAQIRLQRVALESVANAIVITNTEGVIEWVNPAFTKLTGYSAAEAVGATPRLLEWQVRIGARPAVRAVAGAMRRYLETHSRPVPAL